MKIETIKNKIKVIDSVLEYFNLSELKQEIDIYNSLIKYKEKLLFILGLKDSLEMINSKVISDDELKNCKEDVKIIQKLKEYNTRLVKQQEFKTKLAEASSKVDAIEKEIIKLKEEEKVCPLCGSDLMETIHIHK